MRRLGVPFAAFVLAACASEEPTTIPEPAGASALQTHLADGGAAVAFAATLPESPRCARVVSAWSAWLDGRFGPVVVGRAPPVKVGGMDVHLVQLPAGGTYGLRFLGCRDVAGRLVGLERVLGFADTTAGEVAWLGTVELPDLPSDGFTVSVDAGRTPELPDLTLSTTRLRDVETELSDADAEQVARLRKEVEAFNRSERAWEEFSEALLAAYTSEKRAYERLDREVRGRGEEPDSNYYQTLSDLGYLRKVAAKLDTLKSSGLSVNSKFAEMARSARSTTIGGESLAARRRAANMVAEYRPASDVPVPAYAVLDAILPPVSADEVKATW